MGKAEGLAAGKGGMVGNMKEKEIIEIKTILVKKTFGDAGNKIIVEERIDGIEASYIALSDGNVALPMASSQDHKRVFDNDKGPNTGGMGAYSPTPIVTDDLAKKIQEEVIEKTIHAMKNEGISFKGCLYAGIMIKENTPYVLEYNVRMGDPECQTILPKLKTDFEEILEACCNKNLVDINIEWTNKKSLCVVLCSKGYPDTYQKNILINNLDNFILDENNFIFSNESSGYCITSLDIIAIVLIDNLLNSLASLPSLSAIAIT